MGVRAGFFLSLQVGEAWQEAGNSGDRRQGDSRKGGGSLEFDVSKEHEVNTRAWWNRLHDDHEEYDWREIKVVDIEAGGEGRRRERKEGRDSRDEVELKMENTDNERKRKRK